MNQRLSYEGQVAIVTGAGGGLGRTYALLFGSRGAKVVVNDLGGDTKGQGQSSRAADKVVEEIQQAGGIAVANYDSVEDGDKIVQTALDNFGRVDILVNNAGILRDRSFARISNTDWDLVQRVHLRGSFMMTRAAFPVMKKQLFGRIIMTASTSGIFGNFGQANYSAAKLGLLGLSNTVAIEGQKYNIRCNTIAPVSGTRMTEGILPPDLFDEFKPEYVAPLVLWLCHQDCEDTGGLYLTAGGWYGKFRWECTNGTMCRKSRDETVTPEAVRDHWDLITDFTHSYNPESGQEATAHLVGALQDLDSKEETSSQNTSNPTATSGPMSAVGVKLEPKDFTYTFKDVILYALGVGVSTKDEDALKFLYENDEAFGPLPTFCIVPSQAAMMDGSLWANIPGWKVDLTKLLHGEMYIELLKPLPASATLSTDLEVVEVLDKGSGAVLIANTVSRDETGEAVSRCQWSIFLVGEGNFGGPRKGTKAVPLMDHPARAPDASEEVLTGVDQAALYRLSGDRNPLHLDPSFAAMGGFAEPILHGLCFYSISARVILKHYCGNDPARFKAMKTRFAKPVIPGQRLVVDMWKERGRVYFTCTVKETGKACLTGGYVDIVEQDPSAPGAPGGGGVASTAGSVACAGLFGEMTGRVASNPGLADKVKAIFLWNINKNNTLAAQWTVYEIRGGVPGKGQANYEERWLVSWGPAS
ncbi:Peroxisomal multifunctional enzyme type 2 [Chionoecetes opilio]|uniref:Peroxisomal multifunctional enzyme type 2 n=1 Tax=Chionoecetes opilio TaxID=41210 RepID=A0A8J4Y0J9_CHIOP|nr:Peroxisomal multifunctional enzyme type 2 [Chionoecetes opilio]